MFFCLFFLKTERQIEINTVLHNEIIHAQLVVSLEVRSTVKIGAQSGELNLEYSSFYFYICVDHIDTEAMTFTNRMRMFCILEHIFHFI